MEALGPAKTEPPVNEIVSWEGGNRGPCTASNLAVLQQQLHNSQVKTE